VLHRPARRRQPVFKEGSFSFANLGAGHQRGQDCFRGLRPTVAQCALVETAVSVRCLPEVQGRKLPSHSQH
jgi:hypothetical protein